MFSLLTSHFQGLSHLSSGLRLLSFLSLLLSFILQLACYNSVQNHTSDHSHVVGILMSCKARICCGWSILFVSFLPFSSSRGSLEEWWLPGIFSGRLSCWNMLFSCFIPLEPMTVEVFHIIYGLNNCPLGYFHPLTVSSLSLLTHFQLPRGLSQGISDSWLSAISGIPSIFQMLTHPAALCVHLSGARLWHSTCGFGGPAVCSCKIVIWTKSFGLCFLWHFSSLEKKRGASLSHLWITSDSTVTPRGRRTELPCSPNSYRMMGREACCRLSLCSLCTVMAVNVENCLRNIKA